jgi:hypothetical protein
MVEMTVRYRPLYFVYFAYFNSVSPTHLGDMWKYVGMWSWQIKKNKKKEKKKKKKKKKKINLRKGSVQ